MEFDDDEETFYYPCPCGDKFRITVEELRSGEEVARCPSCTLIIRVIYDQVILLIHNHINNNHLLYN